MKTDERNVLYFGIQTTYKIYINKFNSMPSCQQAYYYDILTYICKNCAPYCLKCNYYHVCLQCIVGFTSVNGTCTCSTNKSLIGTICKCGSLQVSITLF